MSKSKRNVILVFGLILIINFMFFPCSKINYWFYYRFEEGPVQEVLDALQRMKDTKGEDYVSQFIRNLTDEQRNKLAELITGKQQKTNFEKTRRVRSDYVKVFFPLVISRANKYKNYIKWEDSVLLMLEKKTKVRTELVREWGRLFEGRRTFSTEELFRDDKTISAARKKKGLSQLAKVNIKIYEIDEEIEAIYKEKNKESHVKFGYDPFYHQIKAGEFFIELGLLILIGVFAYAILVGIRAIRVALRKKGERGANRMKRRKSGIILILIGIGIPLALAPFVNRGWVDFLDIGLDIEYKYFLFIGIILFLIGTGKVIFSFFPKDTNPKI